jgi:hypothetical protein
MMCDSESLAFLHALVASEDLRSRVGFRGLIVTFLFRQDLSLID